MGEQNLTHNVKLPINEFVKCAESELHKLGLYNTTLILSVFLSIL